MTEHTAEDVVISGIKLINGTNLISSFYEHDDYLMLVYPAEVIHEDGYNDINGFEIFDWLPISEHKLIKINHTHYYGFTDVSEEVFDVYLEYIRSFDPSASVTRPPEKDNVTEAPVVVDLFSRK